MGQSVDQEFEGGPDFVERPRLQRSVVETPVDPVRRSLNEREDKNGREEGDDLGSHLASGVEMTLSRILLS
jgi:hypothetical protein